MNAKLRRQLEARKRRIQFRLDKNKLKNLDKPISKECAINCAKAGSPLVILADDGTIYLPISSEMPATGQNERLMKFAGGKVVIKGKVFGRGGSHAIVIQEINSAPLAK